MAAGLYSTQLGDLADRDALEALADEEVACGVQNAASDRFAVPFLSFFDSHSVDCAERREEAVELLNTVRAANIVRREVRSRGSMVM